MANVIPDPEDEIAKVLVHVCPELDAIDVLVHVAVENEVGEVRAGLHQGGLILGVADRPNTNVWILPGNSTHPGVLDSLVEFIPKGNTRLGELLSNGTELSEVKTEQIGNKIQDPFRGDIIQHVTVGEGAHEDNTPDQIDTIVGCDISSGNATHGPTMDVIQCIQWKLRVLRTSRLKSASSSQYQSGQ